MAAERASIWGTDLRYGYSERGGATNDEQMAQERGPQYNIQATTAIEMMRPSYNTRLLQQHNHTLAPSTPPSSHTITPTSP